jgi:TRAP-type uncharacterized transport system fused permease subunit
MGSTLFSIQATVTAALGMYLLAGAAVGFHLRKINLLERLLLTASALALLVPGVKTDVLGLVVVALLIAVQKGLPYWTFLGKK